MRGRLLAEELSTKGLMVQGASVVVRPRQEVAPMQAAASLGADTAAEAVTVVVAALEGQVVSAAALL